MRFCPHCGYDQQREEQPANALRRNTILHGRYWVGNVIGQGGFGITYVGFDLVLEMRVAIKEYYPSSTASRTGSYSSRIQWETRDKAEQAEGIARFVKEARKMAKLDAVPSIVRVWDVLQENDTAYIVMDYVEGVTLKRYLLAHGVMRPEECFVLLDPILESLAVMHERGFIHRDISPDNIMIQPDGTARLLDMGAAVDVRATQGQASMPVAKKYFSAPEQYLESETLENCTDVYAMAATIYYCLTGWVVPEAMERLYSETPLSFPDDSQIPDGIAAVLTRALEVKKSQRTGDMRAFRRQLEDALQEQSLEDAEKEPRKQEAETDSGDFRNPEIRSEEYGKPSDEGTVSRVETGAKHDQQPFIWADRFEGTVSGVETEAEQTARRDSWIWVRRWM